MGRCSARASAHASVFASSSYVGTRDDAIFNVAEAVTFNRDASGANARRVTTGHFAMETRAREVVEGLVAASLSCLMPHQTDHHRTQDSGFAPVLWSGMGNR